MDAVHIDGSMGEGGGQIVRSSAALAVLTGRPLVLDQIRARRRRPGLLRQHLTAVRAAAAVCGGELAGDVMGSRRLELTPGPIRAGEYELEIGTAGSACLVLQTVLLPLLVADGASVVAIEGGTHNPMAPPADFVIRTLVPLLERMGARLEVTVERTGFYPAGGGRLRVSIIGGNALAPIDLVERGAERGRSGEILLAHLPGHIAERERAALVDLLGWSSDEIAIRMVDESAGPGNAILLARRHEQVEEVFTGFGAKGVPAQRVAEEVAAALRRYEAADAPVGPHLADQLLLPLALAGGGSFRTLGLTDHARTNMDVIRRFLPVRFVCEPRGRDDTFVQVSGTPVG